MLRFRAKKNIEIKQVKHIFLCNHQFNRVFANKTNPSKPCSINSLRLTAITLTIHRLLGSPTFTDTV